MHEIIFCQNIPTEKALMFIQFYIFCKIMYCGISIFGSIPIQVIIKDEVLITVGCPIFPSILIAKYLFTGSLKNRSIDNLKTQKKYISMENSQFFNYLLYAKSK